MKLTIDWKNTDYAEIYRKRTEQLDRLRRDPGLLKAVKDYYRDGHYVEFIRDWGMTRDPRRAAEGKQAVFPFIPFPRQEELLHFFNDLLVRKERGVVDKTRDCGASWCALAFACYRFLFFSNNDIGFGSRKEELVDSKSDPKALFPKARQFIELLPPEFKPEDWNERRDAPYLKLINPENGSTIIGEAGDNIGRGGRTMMYFVDEHAFVERAQMVEGALSENTNTQINISTHNGTGTVFYKQTLTFPKERVFEFDWKDDPRKDENWYFRKKNDPGTDPLVFAQEVDRDPSATVSDGFIDVKLLQDAMANGPADVIATGPYIVSVDVAGMGNDKTVINYRRGAVNFPQRTMSKKDGGQVAAEVERLCTKLLAQGTAPLGAIIYELEGPGYEMHGALKLGPYAKACRPIHPGRRLASIEFFNERARMYALAKEWLEEGMKSMVEDRELRIEASSLRYEWRLGGKGERKLLLEDKKQYKSRMALDPRNKMSGPSPDKADAWALSFAPVKLANITKPAQTAVLPDSVTYEEPSWRPLDPVVGY